MQRAVTPRNGHGAERAPGAEFAIQELDGGRHAKKIRISASDRRSAAPSPSLAKKEATANHRCVGGMQGGSQMEHVGGNGDVYVGSAPCTGEATKRQFSSVVAEATGTPSTVAVRTGSTKDRARKRIIVLSCAGGGGHACAARAVEQALSEEHDVRVVTMLDGAVGAYNRLVQNGWDRLAMSLTMLARPLEWVWGSTVTRYRLRTLVREQKPDLIISVYPLCNGVTWNVAKDANIPMLILPTDLEYRHFLTGIDHPGPTLKLGLPYDDDDVRKPAMGILASENLVVTGYPLRAAFNSDDPHREETVAAIRDELGIKEQDRLVLLMMGSQGGGTKLVRYAQTLFEGLRDHPRTVHIVCLCGANQGLKDATIDLQRRICTPDVPVRIHALGFKDDDAYIAALMSLGNVLVTKPGGSTVNEAIARNLFMVFDDSGFSNVSWEQRNMGYAIEHGCGEVLDSEDLVQQVRAALIKRHPHRLESPGRFFLSNVRHVVEDMLKEGAVSRERRAAKDRAHWWSRVVGCRPCRPGQSRRTPFCSELKVGFQGSQHQRNEVVH